MRIFFVIIGRKGFSEIKFFFKSSRLRGMDIFLFFVKLNLFFSNFPYYVCVLFIYNVIVSGNSRFVLVL